MKGLWSGVALVALVASSVFGPSAPAFAQEDVKREFKVYDSQGNSRTCGTLAKRAGDWHVEDCPALFNVIADQQCGNQLLDQGEVCDQSAGVTGCPVGLTCHACAECLAGPTPTPSPAPTRTPGPIVTGNADCPDGIMPKMSIPGSETWGFDWVQAQADVTRTYCFNLNFDTNRLLLAVMDRGGNQCSNKETEFIPPAGSGIASRSEDGIDPAYRFFSAGNLPRGLWKIRVTPRMSPSCNSFYWVAALR